MTTPHRPHRTPVFLATLFVAMAPVAAPAAAQDADPRFPQLAPDAPVGTGTVSACEVGPLDGAECGVFRVPENRDAASGRTLDLHFVRLPATDLGARTDDAVYFFFGGPGVPTIYAAPNMDRALAQLHRSRDFLLVDLRGIGASGALRCDVPQRRLETRFGSIFDTEHLAGCRDTLSRRADLTRYTTPISVDDLEELRRWLGYSAVNLFSGSYGSRVGQVYVRRYPGAVRTLAMVGVTAVSVPGYVNTSPKLQRALELVIRECRQQPACAEAYPELDQDVDRAFARLDDGPVTVAFNGREVRFHAADLGYALRGLLYTRSGEVPYYIAKAARGELQELIEYYVQRTDWISSDDDTSTGNHLSVICAEDIRPVTDADVARAAAGTFLQGHVIRSYREACEVWPEAPLPADFFEPIRSDVPTLLVSGERDPVTPPAEAERVAGTLTNALHVVIPNGGHGTVNDCVLGMITTLMQDGSLENVDSSCKAAAPPTEFRLP